MIGGVLDVVDKPVMMVGHSALLGYAKETGRHVPDIFEPEQKQVIDALDGESLAQVKARLVALLGDKFQGLSDADLRGRRSATPPPRRHRVLELIDFADSAARQLVGLSPSTRVTLNGDLLAESITLLAMAERWANHPAWPSLKSTLATNEAPHTVMMLTAAAYLVDANNGVGIHLLTGQNGNTADIWIEPDLSQRVDLEVKTPHALSLRGPQAALSEPQAIKVLERALKRSSKQRRNTSSSLLVVGGYHMGGSFSTVVSTARGMLALERRKWQGLAGIAIIDCTYESTFDSVDGSTQFSPVARVELAKHLGYVGSLNIELGGPAASTFGAT